MTDDERTHEHTEPAEPINRVPPDDSTAAGPTARPSSDPQLSPDPQPSPDSGQPPGPATAAEAGSASTSPTRSSRHATGRSSRRRRRKAKAHRKAPWWELPALVLFAIAVAVLVKTFVVQPFYIPSQSMEKTLHGCPGCSGDKILVNKPIYDFRDPHPGDIVVFDAPPGWDDEPASHPPSNPVLRLARGFGQLIGFVPPDGLVLVKRVIAVGGQTVKGDAQGNVMISDHGTAGPWRTLNEPYVYKDGADGHADFGPVTVPKGRLWVMGDHRNDSADSRFHCDVSGSGGNFGPGCDPQTSTVPVSNVIGKAFVIAWPPSRWRTLGTPATFEHAALSAGGALPAGTSGALVLPVYLVRRRRRGRRTAA